MYKRSWRRRVGAERGWRNWAVEGKGSVHFSNAGDQAGPPFGNGEMVSQTDQAFVEQGKMGSFGGCGVSIGGDGAYFAGAADTFADSECELIPADAAFIAVVVEAGDKGWCVDDVKDGGSEIGGIGR